MSKKNNGKRVKKIKSAKARKVKRIILAVLGIILIVALCFIIPKVVKIYKLSSEAKSIVSSCTENTFKDSKTTLIYDTNDNELCSMKNSKDLYYVEFDDIPATLADAFVVMEDRNFYNHKGIDYKAIIRAVIANQKSNEIAQGASTITQQLAKNVFLTQEVTWERKIKEMFIAFNLEKKFTKNQILEFYLNNIYFGNGYYGVEAAAKGYFSKSSKELTLSEQAFIAAIPNNPSRYNPLTNFDNTLGRRDLILDQLYDQGYINSMDYYSAKNEQITLNPQQEEKVNNSVVTYVRHCATESLMSSTGFTFRYSFESQTDYDAYQEYYEKVYTECQQKLIGGGYIIYTSIDMDIQEKLQNAVDTNLSKYTAVSENGVYDMQGAATCVDNESGNVVAIVGSRTQDNITGDVLNRAYQSYRQPGSSIKPLSVYTPYLQLGNTPDTVVDDSPIEGGPSNADKTYAGKITVREAVRLSKNTVAWNIYNNVLTSKTGSNYLIKMGFKKIWEDQDVAAGALGGFTDGVTTEEMAGAYAAIENDGVFRKPTCIKKIEDSSGKSVVDESDREVRIYEVNACRMMTDMMKTVVESGTGKSAKPQNAIVAGKTGTTNSNKDAWFCGFSKYYTTTVWMGYDYPKEISNSGICANAIFKQFMTEIHKDLTPIDFTKYSISGGSANDLETQQPSTETEEIEEPTTDNYYEESETSTERVTQPSSTQKTTSQKTESQNTTDATNKSTTSTPEKTTAATSGGTGEDIDIPTETDSDITE